jgi:hypothetical protein
MADYGLMGVDWEQRIDFDRLRRDRKRKAQEAAKASGVDMLFVFRTEDSRYVTGYRHHLGPAFILGNAVTVVLPDADPILFTMDHVMCKNAMPWMPEGTIRERANFRESAAIRNWTAKIKEEFGDLAGKTIGIDIFTPVLARTLQEEFPKAEIVDGYEVLMKAKIIKTEDEIQCMKAANAMTEAAMDAAIEFLRPGVKECEVLAVAWKTMTDLGSEWTQCSNIVASGPYTYPYRRFTSDRIIRKGDLVIIDIGACFNGYYGDLTRTWLCGDDLKRGTPDQIGTSTSCATTRSGTPARKASPATPTPTSSPPPTRTCSTASVTARASTLGRRRTSAPRPRTRRSRSRSACSSTSNPTPARRASAGCASRTTWWCARTAPRSTPPTRSTSVW